MRKLSGGEKRSYAALTIAIIAMLPDWLRLFGVESIGNLTLPDLSALNPWIPFITPALGLYAGVGLSRRITTERNSRTVRTVASQQQEREVRQILKSLPIDIKTMLYVLATHDYIYCPLDQWQTDDDMNHPFFQQFMSWETIDRFTVRVEAKDLFKIAAQQYEDVFSVITDEMMREYAIYDPECKRRTSVHRSTSLDWWWYSAEPSMDQDKQFEEQLKAQKQRPPS